MVKISFLGACREIGRSAILLESEKSDTALLLDYGVKLDNPDDNFPLHVSGRKISGICLTHAHIDHSGGIPLFYISGKPPLYTTTLTREITKILIRDMLKLSGSKLPFEYPEMKKMMAAHRPVDYQNRIRVADGVYVTLYNAGHIPGSAVVLVEMDGKRILYTGDINATPTCLLPAMHAKYPPLDVLITESSYALDSHPPREEIEKNFIEAVYNALDEGGRVLVPAFGVARSQEVLAVLMKYKVRNPIFVDGMARAVSQLFLRYPAFFRHYKYLDKGVKRATIVGRRQAYKDRKRAVTQKGSIIIAPSGMMKGGTVRYYARNVLPDPNSAVLLVSYQIENSPGRRLLETGEYTDVYHRQQRRLDVKAAVNFFDFSAHSGRDQLLGFIDDLTFQDQTNVFCVHGEEEACHALAKEVNHRHEDALAFAPEAGDSFEL